jgi:hypothetical protein
MNLAACGDWLKNPNSPHPHRQFLWIEPLIAISPMHHSSLLFKPVTSAASILLLLAFLSCSNPIPAVQADDSSTKDEAHSHEHHPVTGRKIASPGPMDNAKFLLVNDESKTAILPIIATYNDANYGMNFNGHHRGKAIYTVPKGWKITVQFQNMSPVPHSAIIVEESMIKKLQFSEPYFEGASTREPLKGLVKKDEFSFVADESGKFAIACGFPAHSASGHWISLIISPEAHTATLVFPDKP